MQQNNFDNERQPLKPKAGGMALNQTNDVNESSLPDATHDAGTDEAKKKKMIKYGIIAGILVIIAAVVVVLLLTLGGAKPIPPTPVVTGDVNFYYIETNTEQNTAHSRRGFINFDKDKFNKKSQLFFQDTERLLLEQQKKGKIGVNWNRSVSLGENNKIKERLEYTFDMIDFQVARFQLTTADEDRFSIPSEVVSKPETNKNMRLESIGFDFKSSVNASKDEAFNFGFHDVMKTDNVYLTTKKQALFFSDKYIQMDFLLNS
jgi:hypothetical protein